MKHSLEYVAWMNRWGVNIGGRCVLHTVLFLED